MSIILFEIYRFLFVSSIIFVAYNIGDVIIKAFARFKYGVETKYILTHKSIIPLWVAIGIIITFLTKTFTV